MGVEENLRPNILTKIREIGQTARLSSRSPGDFAKRGGWIWTTQLHLVRQARRCEGGFPVGRASRNSKGLCRKGTTDQLDISLIDGASDKARGTQAPGIDDVSHDWKLASPDIAWVFRAATTYSAPAS